MSICQTCEMVDTLASPFVIYQDDLLILSHCVDMNVPGYLILSPVRHLVRYDDLTDNEAVSLALLLKRAVHAVSQLVGVEKVYLLNLGELTEHVHFHIFPRYGGMCDDLNAKNEKGVIDGALLFSQARKAYKVIDVLWINGLSNN